MSRSQGEVDRENLLVLVAVQAALGLIGPTIKSVALELSNLNEVKLQVWATENLDEVNEDAIDMVGDMEALLWPDVPSIDAQILDTDPKKTTTNWIGRYIYAAKVY